VAYNHQGQRVGRPHVAIWAETEIVLAADLGSGTDEVRATAAGLLRRALSCLPAAARASGQVAVRAGAGYFAGALARAARDERIAFAIGAKRIAPLWRLLDGIAEQDWHDATGMHGAQVAVSDYCPDWWPAATSLLIRRVRLDPGQVPADPRSRRRRTLHPDQRALPFPELENADAIYAYSFILTSLDVSDPGKAVAAEHWYRQRATVENVFRDGKHGALRHLPSGYPRVNMAWMWGALLAASIAAWLHQLTAATAGPDITAGHGVRGGKAMIETLRWWCCSLARCRRASSETAPWAQSMPVPLGQGLRLRGRGTAVLYRWSRPALTSRRQWPAGRLPRVNGGSRSADAITRSCPSSCPAGVSRVITRTCSSVGLENACTAPGATTTDSPGPRWRTACPTRTRSLPSTTSNVSSSTRCQWAGGPDSPDGRMASNSNTSPSVSDPVRMMEKAHRSASAVPGPRSSLRTWYPCSARIGR
jgi:hypothetical protein